MDWKTKAKIFRLLEILPFGDALHFGLQKHVTREMPRRAEAIDSLCATAKKVFSDLAEYYRDEIGNIHLVEIGAGRDLAVAIALRMQGVGKITCIDISRLANPALTNHVAREMAQRLGVRDPNLDSLQKLADFGIDYKAPASIHDAQFAGQKFDAAFSIDTLEHIPVEDLKRVLSEIRRHLPVRGRMVHVIDYSDHFARGAAHSRFNFLKFDDDEWAPFNSRFQYVNRLRHSEFVELIAAAGFSIESADAVESPPEPDIQQELADRFRKFDTSDLFTLRAKIAAIAA